MARRERHRAVDGLVPETRMTDERQSRGAGFRATMALVAALVYPASLGPACWISSRYGRRTPGWCAGAMSTIYRPLIWLFATPGGHASRSQLMPALKWYSEVNAAKHWHCFWFDRGDYRSQPECRLKKSKQRLINAQIFTGGRPAPSAFPQR